MNHLATALAVLVLAGGPALAAGGDGRGGSSGNAEPQCYNGKVYDKKKKICVSPDAHLDNGSLIDHAYMLARTGKPHDALSFLARVVGRDDPHFLNIKGFATRKAGDVDAGIAFYRQALAIDADNVLVREYLGEAFATKGDFVRARAQLDKIVRICGNTECTEYRELADAIVKAGGTI